MWKGMLIDLSDGDFEVEGYKFGLFRFWDFSKSILRFEQTRIYNCG